MLTGATCSASRNPGLIKGTQPPLTYKLTYNGQAGIKTQKTFSNPFSRFYHSVGYVYNAWSGDILGAAKHKNADSHIFDWSKDFVEKHYTTVQIGVQAHNAQKYNEFKIPELQLAHNNATYDLNKANEREKRGLNRRAEDLLNKKADEHVKNIKKILPAEQRSMEQGEEKKEQQQGIPLEDSINAAASASMKTSLIFKQWEKTDAEINKMNNNKFEKFTTALKNLYNAHQPIIPRKPSGIIIQQLSVGAEKEDVHKEDVHAEEQAVQKAKEDLRTANVSAADINKYEQLFYEEKLLANKYAIARRDSKTLLDHFLDQLPEKDKPLALATLNTYDSSEKLTTAINEALMEKKNANKEERKEQVDQKVEAERKIFNKTINVISNMKDGKEVAPKDILSIQNEKSLLDYYDITAEELSRIKTIACTFQAMGIKSITVPTKENNTHEILIIDTTDNKLAF